MALKKSTIRDVSELAGVSISTVSRILNNSEKARTIPEEVRRRVLESARQLHYVPNANARRVFTHRAGILGLLVPSHLRLKMHVFEDHHLTRLISGIETGIGESDYRLLLIFNDARFMARREHLSLIQSQNIDGMLVWGAQPGETCWRESVEAKLPVLFVCTVPGEPECFNYVINATRPALRNIMEELIRRGHRRILFYGERSPRFLEEEMLAEIAELRSESPSIRIDAAEIEPGEVVRLPMEQFLGPEPTTALVTYNYSMAAKAIPQLLAARLRIPEQVEVASCYGYSDGGVRISTAAVDDFEMGRRAAVELQRMIEEPERRVRVRIPAAFLPGGTTRNLADAAAVPAV